MAKKIVLEARLKGAQKTKRGLKNIDSGLVNLGKSAVIAAAGFLALKKAFTLTIDFKNFARDAEETTNKFKTVFSSMAVVATQTAKTLGESFGMAHTTAMELLGDTGDILVGFGFTEKAALELSLKVNELSVDLASFTNFAGGASGASKALTKAILGETESAKTLGIVLRQGTKEFKESVKVLQETEGMTFNQAMATTLLNEAYRQSGKAIGDFSRTQHQLANQERILSERIKELKEELGTSLLPVFNSLTSASISFIESIDAEKIKSYTTAFTGITTAIVFYNSQILLARMRTIAFQATLVKTGWGALIVGAGLAIGKLIEMSGVFGDVSKEADELDELLKKIGARQFIQLAPEEQKERILETKKELLSMFKEGAKGSKYFESFIKSTAVAINRQGLMASEAESIYTIAVKAGVAERITAREEEVEKIKLTESQIATIQGEFNNRYLEMTVASFDLQKLELANAVDRFREAGIEEIDIANFVAESKKQIAQNELQFKLGTLSSLTGALGSLNASMKGSALVSKRLAQATAIIDTYAGANKALAASPPPWNFIAATAVIAAGLANVVNIEAQKFAQGGNFVTSGPQMIMVGDNPSGRERVQITPSEQSQSFNQGGITLNISAPLIDETVIDSIIPAIQKAQRLNLA